MYLTYKAKIIADKETSEILNNLCFSATKLYNSVNWYLRKEWESQRALFDYLDSIGYPHDGLKIPLNRSELQNKFKENQWATRLHSQSAQFIILEILSAYKSWFVLRKNGHSNAKPPSFRRKTFLSPVTFVQSAPELFAFRGESGCTTAFRGKTYLGFSLGTKREDGIREITVKVTPRNPLPKEGTLKNIKITYDTVTGNYYAHLVIDVPQPVRQLQLFPTNVVAIDLGLNNLITATFSDGSSYIISGRELKTIRRYWQKLRAKVKPPSVFFSGRERCTVEGVVTTLKEVSPSALTPHSTLAFKKPSRRYLQICRKESRQIIHRLHIISKQFVELCEEKGVTHIVLGDLTGIRQNIDYSEKTNQQLHNWNFAKLVDFLSYKAQKVGIVTEQISEKYTSQTCCKCGLRKKSNRKTRGLYVCDCGNKINADRNGANNILKRYLRYRSSGSVALPVVTLVLQRTDAHCLRTYIKHSVIM